ncbi:cyclase family protein [Billgrantia montanilacus]|uniref:Cyclase family protein n=1 Tax=Billgrantia montanilacus TaxID=2282305 RepID=A0A368U1K2_9GAMM|nr:cyclase family protein [Halomonas montanilacus]RCV90904.1 cyclase family protein [Halomonas montanilacus]
MTSRLILLPTVACIAALNVATALAAPPGEHQAHLESIQQTPVPPWPRGDEAGMGNTQSSGTWQRCAFHLMQPGAQAYELAYPRTATMPQSPFAEPESYRFDPSSGIPGTRHGFNTESINGNIGGQGTQLDGLGHFAHLSEPWSGEGEFPAEDLRYYGGFSQDDVKPTPDAPLERLGLENLPPIVSSAVLLDAAAYLNDGEALAAGDLVTRDDIQGMIEAQGLAWRGLLPGDVLYIHTGWGNLWEAGDERYYAQGPGLAYDTMAWLEEQAVVLVALDNPFTDPAPEGMLTGEAIPEGVPDGLPFAIHHHNLTQSGIYQIQNARLADLAADQVWTSCTMILPTLTKGAAQAPVRPVAIGTPAQP